jgi:Terminase large subunit, T4likevirus-type, N-terminal/Intein splicing domain
MADKTLRDVIKEEYKKCLLDPIYFMKKYVKIQHPIRGTVNFDLYPFQEQALRDLVENRFSVILKSRQMGISTLVAAYSLWLMIFHTDKNIRCVSITQETSKEIVTRVRFANQHLPSFLKIKEKEDNRLSLLLANGSAIKAVSSAGDAIRGGSLSLLIIDEAAFIDNIDEIWVAAQPALGTGGKAIILSTPNGVDNFFHTTWIEAEEQKNGFKPIRLPWNLHPERDQSWRDEQTRLNGVKNSAQECFEENTRIYTDHGFIKIKDIKIGDMVLTHTGEFFPVVNVFKKTSNNYSTIHSALNQKEIKVTNNHPFYVKDKQWIQLKDISNKQLCTSFPPLQYINNNTDVFDLYKNIKPKYFKYKLCNEDTQFFIDDLRFKTIHNRYIQLNYEFGCIIGCYLAKGCCQNNDSQIDFSFNCKIEQNEWVETLIKYMKNVFGINTYQIKKCGNNSGNITFYSQIVCETIKYFSDGIDCHTKCLSKKTYDLQNIKFFIGIVDGCFIGDGMDLTKYNKTFSTKSENLMYDIKYILSILDVGLISQKYYDSSLENEHKCYVLTILNTKEIEYKNLYDIDTDNYQLSQIIKEEKSENEIIDVYNLEVKTNHSYVTEHFIVHNCDCDFATTGNTVIDIPTLDFYKKEKVRDPIEMRGIDKGYWIWEYPDYSRNYIISADVARGDGEDYSAFHVIDIENLVQVAEYHGKLGTKEYGNFLVGAATEYNNALLVVENANIGWAVLQQIIDRQYPNTYYSSTDMKYVDVEQQLTNKYNSEEKKLKPGFTTSIATRPLMVSRMEMYFRERSIEVRSLRLINELRTFIWNGNKPEASGKKHDDLVMAYCIGLWVRDTALKLRKESIELNKSMLANMNRVGNNVVYKPEQLSAKEAWNMQVGSGTNIISQKKENLLWLI